MSSSQTYLLVQIGQVSCQSSTGYGIALKTSGYGETQLYLDIDYVVVETAVSDKIYTTTIDDTSSYCEYLGAWGNSQPQMPTRYYNTTAHYTWTVDSSVTCK